MAQRPNPKTGCLTAVVRRLLCSGSQQTHPSDTILDSSDETLQLLIPYQETILEQETKKELINTKPENDDVFEAPEEVSPPPPPPPPPPSNVVAKLMGLDNNPEPGSNRFRYFDDSGSAVARSKSVNFMDYILRVKEEEEDDDKDGQRQCRRVKASVSFREIVPTSARWSSNQNQQQKKHDFLLLYLDKLDEKRELVNGISSSSSLSRSKRFEKVLEDSKKTRKKKEEEEKVAKKFKDEPRKVVKKKKTNKKKSNGESDVNGAKKVRWFLSPSKSSKMTSEKTALLGGGDESSPETKSSSNASPVSVLDRDLYDYLILDDDYYFSGDSESASELSTKQTETTTTKSSSSSSTSRTRTNTKKAENTNSDSSEETEFITKLMNMLSDLSEEDMNSDSSTWVSTVSSTKPVDFSQVEDFCVEFGQEILDLVMDQLVDELCI